jgi:hypothetical protein
MTTTALHAAIAATLAGGFAGSPTELATLLGCPVRKVYEARARGLTWKIGGELAGRHFNDWTVLEVAPPRAGQTRWVVRCTCGLVVERYAADITSGRSKRCAQGPAAHGLLVERRRARSVPCPTCGARRACVDGPPDPNGPRGVVFEYGVHVARARLAGCVPLGTAMQLDAATGATPVASWVSTAEDGALWRARRALVDLLREGYGVEAASTPEGGSANEGA